MARIYSIDGFPGSYVFASDASVEAQYPGRWTFIREDVEPPKPRHLTVLAFRNRFTQAEKTTLEIAALDNPAASMAQRSQAAALRASMKDQETAKFIDLDRADTRAGVQALEAAGILAAGRAAVILEAPIQDSERP